MEERDCEVVRRSDRHRSAMGGQPPGERHSALGRRRHHRAGGAGDVDSGMAVLAIFVSAEIEATQHRAVRRPGPRLAPRRGEKREDDQRRQ
jgi:hypothetical protein